MSKELEYFKSKTDMIRRDIITMLGEAGSGHPGGSLSAVEILSSLYYELMEKGDKFVLSKGHSAPALYSILADKGYFAKKELMTLRKLGSILQGHPDMKKTPGVHFSTGSLGQGLSAANGMAIAAKYDKSDQRIYVLLGDGELQEGQIWEAVMTARHRRLDNLIAYVDHNNLQIDGSCVEVKSLDKIKEKFLSFGWGVFTIDGHDIKSIIETTRKAWQVKGKPVCIISNTIKGKGISFMEDEVGWHGKAPSKEEVELALKELKGVE
ncbi:transketolase [Iocasia frigidifontis]|uniref:Transketolase n=1 Tax=Iocasia fonsfrigidae TaxID=2682810 RepID=A0A8A7K6H3_9FIRM|nr:transketolase [Iocasia fonsfrigidae]QTL97316.1 transketolase [Iocasia fonsfrigidae]